MLMDKLYIATLLDWLTVFGFITATAFITWQVVTRSKKQ